MPELTGSDVTTAFDDAPEKCPGCGQWVSVAECDVCALKDAHDRVAVVIEKRTA